MSETESNLDLFRLQSPLIYVPTWTSKKSVPCTSRPCRHKGITYSLPSLFKFGILLIMNVFALIFNFLKYHIKISCTLIANFFGHR